MEAPKSASSGTSSPSDQGDARGFDLQNYQDQVGLRSREETPLEDVLLETLTDKDCDVYNLSQGQRLAVIFNHTFYLNNHMEPRQGSDNDAQAIKQVFEPLQFHVQELTNPTVNQILNKLYEIQKLPDLSCLALFILTHGEADGLLHAWDNCYNLSKTIIPEIQPDVCPSLAGRPKMIFIQACQGEETDSGVMVKLSRHRHTSADSSRMSPNAAYCIPNYCDMLIFSAAYSGHYSFRSPSKGSWFIQALCKEIENADPDQELISVLTKVSRSVALNKTSNCPNHPRFHGKKQVPLKQDTLLRKIYLKEPSKVTITTKEADHAHEDIKNKSNLTIDALKREHNCLCM